MLILPKAVKEQTSLIAQKMNSLILKLAYDGRARIKIRFRKSENIENTYLIEVNCGHNVMHDTLELNFEPFKRRYWSYIRDTIENTLCIPNCKKSRYGGYTFYA